MDLFSRISHPYINVTMVTLEFEAAPSPSSTFIQSPETRRSRQHEKSEFIQLNASHHQSQDHFEYTNKTKRADRYSSGPFIKQQQTSPNTMKTMRVLFLSAILAVSMLVASASDVPEAKVQISRRKACK